MVLREKKKKYCQHTYHFLDSEKNNRPNYTRYSELILRILLTEVSTDTYTE